MRPRADAIEDGANHFEFEPGLRGASGGRRRDTVYPAGRRFDKGAIGNHFISVRGLRSDGTVKIIVPCENVVRVLATLHDEDDDIGVHLPAGAEGNVNGGAYRLASSQRDARTRFSKQTQDRLRVLRIATFENIGDRSRIHMRQGRDDLGRGLVDIDLRSAIKNRYEGKSGIDELRPAIPARAAIRRCFEKVPAAACNPSPHPCRRRLPGLRLLVAALSARR